MRRTLLFLAVLALLLGGNVALYLAAEDLRAHPVDFAGLSPTERLAPAGLTRRQFNDLTLGFAETAGPYRVGAFGTHQIRYFGRDAFGPDAPPDQFFNYNLQTLGLPGVRDLLIHMEARSTLPRDLIIVGLMTPNMHNGNYILTRDEDIPADLIAAGEAAFDGGSSWAAAKARLHQGAKVVAEVLNYQLLFNLVLNRGKPIARLDVEACGPDRADAALARLKDWQRALYARLPVSVLLAAGILDRVGDCALPAVRRLVLHDALRADGSADWLFGDPPLLNEHPLIESTRKLSFGDEAAIARSLRQIQAIATRNGARMVVVIPPVYETDRPSTVNRIVTAALALVPDIPVIDDRDDRLPVEAFYDHRHPKRAYFHDVVQRIRGMGLLPPPQTQTGNAPQ